MHRIKKYANRKLYDSTDKTYISRKGLSELINRGEDILIIDNKTGEDITASIVSGLIAATSQESGSTVSSGLLIQLFKKGSTAVTDYAKKYVSLWQRSFIMAEDEIDQMVRRLVKNRELSRAEGVHLKNEIMGYTASIKAWMSDTIDRRIKEVVAATPLATRDQVAGLNQRIQVLEDKLRQLEKNR